MMRIIVLFFTASFFKSAIIFPKKKDKIINTTEVGKIENKLSAG